MPQHLVLNKENFDKENLVLESSSKNKPNIILDLNRINEVPLGQLPDDLKDDKEQADDVTTVVASDGFVPVKREFNNRKKNRKRENRS